jgi:hypothetical protein
MKLFRFAFLICALGASANLFASESWEVALSRMLLVQPSVELNRTNCVPLLLNSFQSNNVVKALIFMPGSTDEIYFFRRVRARLTNASPSLLDAIVALTNQTFIQVAFQPPLLILHTTEDSLDVIANEKNKSTSDKLRQRNVPGRILLNDADWDEVHSALQKYLSIGLRPREGSPDSWHFYRDSFVAEGLTEWEMLETLALAGKTTFTVHWLTADFEPDRRQGIAPKLEKFPIR